MNEIILPSVRSSTEKVDEIIRIITPMIDDIWKRENELNRIIIRDNHGDSKGIITPRYSPIIGQLGSAKQKLSAGIIYHSNIRAHDMDLI